MFKTRIKLGSLSDIEIAGSLINQGFPFSVLAKCLQFILKKFLILIRYLRIDF